jgi:hypothetical protein
MLMVRKTLTPVCIFKSGFTAVVGSWYHLAGVYDAKIRVS